MDQFFSLIVLFYNSIIGLFSRTFFNFAGFRVSLTGIIFAVLFFSFIINLFWKGVRT